MIRSSCVALLAGPGPVVSGEWLIFLAVCVCGAVTRLTGWYLYSPPVLLTGVCICTISLTWPPECIKLSELMSNHKLLLWKTWKHDCFTPPEAEQTWPPVCRTACLLHFPWIPGETAVHTCPTVWDGEQTRTTEGKMRIKNKMGTLIQAGDSLFKLQKHVTDWHKFTADTAGQSGWKARCGCDYYSARAEMHLSLEGQKLEIIIYIYIHICLYWLK